MLLLLLLLLSVLAREVIGLSQTVQS